MPEKRWNLTDEISKAHLTQIFSGGACNILNGEGKLLRNTERDSINAWLTSHDVVIFDPQIHPDTHGTEYDYEVHHPLELEARAAAKVNLYEVSPRTFGGITSFEIAADHFKQHEHMVIYYSDGNANQDMIPEHSSKGHPLFVPDAIFDNDAAMKAHYKEYIKNANNMRKYLLTFAKEMDSLGVSFSDNPAKGDVVVTPHRMHAVEMFKAVVMAASNERVFVTFTGGEDAQDTKGNPILISPENPREMEMHTLLDQYVDEGNALRRAIAELIEISVFVRVVYTQRSVLVALDEVLKLSGIID